MDDITNHNGCLLDYEVIQDDILPDVKLHKWITPTGRVRYAIDTYIPSIDAGMNNHERAIAYESALGYRLRVNNVQDSYFIKPKTLDAGDIRRILFNNREAIRASGEPLTIGFQYDGALPTEGSSKNTREILRHCSESGIRVLLSTAYTPSNELRKAAIEAGESGMYIELRIPGPFGVNTPDLAQICFITRRLQLYANGTRYILRFGPILPMQNLEPSISIEDFWSRAGQENAFTGKREIQTINYYGSRVFLPSIPIVPLEYAKTLEKIYKSYKASGSKKLIPVSMDTLLSANNPRLTISAVLSSWESGKGIEIIGDLLSNNDQFSSPAGPMQRYEKISNAHTYLESDRALFDSIYAISAHPETTAELVA